MTTYIQVPKKTSKDTVIEYMLPVIQPTGKTQQLQEKGGVTITAEIVPFTVMRGERMNKNITYADPNKNGYDIYEVSNVPYYTISPEKVMFKIRIRNNEQVPLKLSEIGFALIIDGIQFSFPKEELDDWNKGIILTGFDKEYTIYGPALNGLNTAKVVYLFLNGVPVSYDKAGTVTKKSNFEWYFTCENQKVSTPEQIRYNYSEEPIYKEQCKSCNGRGYFEKQQTCGVCNGKGTFVGTDGKTYSCTNCGGKGQIIVKEKCLNCKAVGMISYPKSKLPPVENSTIWRGWWVNVVTKPSGAVISIFNPNTLLYTSDDIATSPNKVRFWYQPGSSENPIMVSYGGKTVKVLPYNEGKQSPKIVIDFLSGTEPIVVKGEKVD